jgi:KUP system potassium uptake protein
VLVHKALMPESNISTREALSLRMKYAIRHLVGSPIKWFGLAPYNPQIEVQPLFVTTRRPPRLRRETVKANDARRGSGAGAGSVVGAGGKIEVKIADSSANPGVSAGLAKLAAEKPAAEKAAAEKAAVEKAVEKHTEASAASGTGKTSSPHNADKTAKKPGKTAAEQSAEKSAAAAPKNRRGETDGKA